MSTMDVIQTIGVISTMVISIIALLQSNKSNKISKKANNLSKEANALSDEANKTSKEANALSFEVYRDTQKEYMPIITFAKNIEVKEKSILELTNEITFDFFNTIEQVLDNKDDFDVYEKFKCICVTIENIGKGFVTGMSIEDLKIIFGNEILIFNDLENDLDIKPVCYLKKKAERLFILKPDNTTEINLLVSKDFAKPEDMEGMISLLDSEIDKKAIEELDIMMSMSIDIGSLNKNRAEYLEENLIGTYEGGKLKCCSFEKLQKI